MSAGSKRGRKQETVIAALLSEPTQAAAATKAGVSEATLQRWLRLPAFRAAYREARRQVVEVAVARLQQVASEAVQALERGLKCGNPGAELRAAQLVLEHAFKGTELLDQAQRLEELERLILGGPSPERDPKKARPAGGPDPKSPDNGQPAAAPAESGPGQFDESSGPDSGPVAGPPAAFGFTEDASPLFPSVGQEPFGRGPGFAGGTA
jgi:hypothetical protein